MLGRVADETASQAAEWVVRPERGGRFTLLNRREEKFLAVSSSGRLIRERKPDAFTFSPSTGCSQYPEIEVGASRRPRGSQFVYVVPGGIVRFVGVGTKQVTSDAGVLSGYVARAGLR
jgi:hypothetical protein